jgi:sensor histidine kinase YesM
MKQRILKAIHFVGIISILLFLCISAFVVMRKGFDFDTILYAYLINIIPAILITWGDYVFVKKVKSIIPSLPVIGFILEVIATSILIYSLTYILICFGGHILLMGNHIKIERVVISIFLSNTMTIMMVEIYVRHQIQSKTNLHIVEVEKEKAHYQFIALKNQINPHFLFNSMNVLSSLIYQDADKANIFTKKLSATYRYLLMTDKRMLVSLAEELEFVDNYVYLQKIRFGNNLNVRIKTNEEYSSYMLVPASIQMLVENAIKHNIATTSAPLYITVNIEQEKVTVLNNIQLRSDICKNGMGLKNLKTQYQLQGKQIQIIQTDNIFKVELPIIKKHEGT